jgi:hypothetical protein
MLQEVYKKIYEIALSIYKNDGQSLDRWLTQSNNEGNGDNDAKEVSISTYKEQFKNMLSLDIWIDKLLEWQRNDYKLEMPAKEQVDPLSWNKVLKSKLNQVISEENAAMQYQQTDVTPSGDIQRKRPFPAAYTPVDNIKDQDKFRQTKVKKVSEYMDEPKSENKILNFEDTNTPFMNNHHQKDESVVSTEKTSEISHVIRRQNQQKLVNPNKV